MPLHLTFLDTGETQHVFVCADDPGWVYKIPSAFGYLLPFDHRCSRFGRQQFTPRLLDRPLYLVSCQLPLRAHRALAVHLRPRLADWHLQWCWWGLAPLNGVAKVVRALGERYVASRARRNQVRDFRVMLRLLEHLKKLPLADVALPARWHRRVRVTLAIDGRRHAYVGPLLRQRRADTFLTGGPEDYGSFEWSRLVQLVHSLWRNGVAFMTPQEAIGPFGWALLGGELRLADTGALTRHGGRARKALGDDYVNHRVRINLRRVAEPERARAREYYDFVREQINPEMFDRLWKTGHGETRLRSLPSTAPTASR